MKQKFLVLYAVVWFCGQLHAASDVDGSKDHPMFGRMPGFFIESYEHNFDEVEFMTGAETNEKKEGSKTILMMSLPEEAGKQSPSWLQIVRNFQAASAKLGGVLVFKNDDTATLKLKKGEQEVWARLDLNGGSTGQVVQYRLSVLEVGEMKQEMVAGVLLEALNRDGHIAIEIHFDTAKAVIKEDSKPVIEQMVTLMNDNAELKVEIQGHTDNAGEAKANQLLSTQRAAAVKKALTDAGVDAARMTSKGYGATKPVADNSTPEGQAKNRRVELVKR